MKRRKLICALSPMAASHGLQAARLLFYPN